MESCLIFFPAGLLEFMGQQWPSLRGDYPAPGLQNFCNALIFRDLWPGTNCNARLHGLRYKGPYGMATCRPGNIHSDSCDFLQHFETEILFLILDSEAVWYGN